MSSSQTKYTNISLTKSTTNKEENAEHIHRIPTTTTSLLVRKICENLIFQFSELSRKVEWARVQCLLNKWVVDGSGVGGRDEQNQQKKIAFENDDKIWENIQKSSENHVWILTKFLLQLFTLYMITTRLRCCLGKMIQSVQDEENFPAWEFALWRCSYWMRFKHKYFPKETSLSLLRFVTSQKFGKLHFNPV